MYAQISLAVGFNPFPAAFNPFPGVFDPFPVAFNPFPAWGFVLLVPVPLKRMYLWWGLCPLNLLVCQVIVTIGQLGSLLLCLCVMSFEC